MADLPDIFDAAPFALESAEKGRRLLVRVNELDLNHFANCSAYKNILTAYGRAPGSAARLEDVPFVPVRLFKELELKSVEDALVLKTLSSSGTTGQNPSRIFLDARTARLQTFALVRIMQSFLGKQRLPMIVIDHPGVIRDPASFSARGAGILGMMNFGGSPAYVLDDETMEINVDRLSRTIEKNLGKPMLLFGFTFMVWKYFITSLEKNRRTLDLSGSVLVHSGGWKKLEDEAVDNSTFKHRLSAVTGISKVHNFYGMVEQVGSVYVECENGHLHAPAYSDIIIRNPYDWSPVPHGEQGLVQLISAIPESYPGHSVLSEDIGIVHGEDDCACGRKGKHFSILGRVPRAEVRGCSDTHTQVAA